MAQPKGLLMEKHNLQIGSKLYAYSINHGWGRNAKRLDFTITRETKTMWILSLDGEEFQKIKKDTLFPHGNGYSVVIKPDEHLDNEVKKICDYNELRSLISYIESDMNKKAGNLSEKNMNILEFLRGLK